MHFILIPGRGIVNQSAVDYYAAAMSKALQTVEASNWMYNRIRRYIDQLDIAEAAGVPLKQLPAGAPRWARQAVADGAEVYAVSPPNEKFADVLAYLLSLERNIDGPHAREARKRLKALWRLRLIDIADQSAGWVKMTTSAVTEEKSKRDVLRLSDGSRWILVKEEEELDEEGRLMRNCLGIGSYDVLYDDHHIYSLRDPRDYPHIVVEVLDGTVVQLLGRGNHPPHVRYQKAIIALLDHLHVVPHDNALASLISAMIVHDGSRYLDLRKSADLIDFLHERDPIYRFNGNYYLCGTHYIYLCESIQSLRYLCLRRLDRHRHMGLPLWLQRDFLQFVYEREWKTGRVDLCPRTPAAIVGGDDGVKFVVSHMKPFCKRFGGYRAYARRGYSFSGDHIIICENSDPIGEVIVNDQTLTQITCYRKWYTGDYAMLVKVMNKLAITKCEPYLVQQYIGQRKTLLRGQRWYSAGGVIR